MPILDPGGRAAPDMLPWKTKAHCLDAQVPGHQGATRDQRIAGYLQRDPHSAVPGVPQGNRIEVRHGACRLCGPNPALWFRHASAPGILPGRPLALG